VSAFERVDVRPDSPAWEEERRKTLGASEVPAVLGLSPWATPLDVYRAKHGADRGMDPELAFIGHAEELTMGRWLRRFRPDLGVLRRGFMARSTRAPWLHASIDRFVVKRGDWVPVQMKTAHQYAGGEWEEEIPLAVQAQIQTELYVLDAPRGYALAFVGGRRFHVHPIEADREFQEDVLLPETRRFWEENVLRRREPDPSNTAEAVSLWPDPQGVLEADEDTAGLVRYLLDAQAERKRLEDLVDELKLSLQVRMRAAETLLAPDGKTVLATWKTKQGARRLNGDALRADHPDLADAYTIQGAASRTFLPKKPKKEKTNEQ